MAFFEFAEQTLKYAANHDEQIYELLDNLKLAERERKAPEIKNATLSCKKIFDTFGIKQKSWHGDLQDTIKSLYSDRGKLKAGELPGSATESSAA